MEHFRSRARANLGKLQTFIFVWLTLSGYYTVLSIRDRRHFWESRSSKWLSLALVLNILIVYAISTMGLPGLTLITNPEFLFIIGYGFVFCLLVNDLVKVPRAATTLFTLLSTILLDLN